MQLTAAGTISGVVRDLAAGQGAGARVTYVRRGAQNDVVAMTGTRKDGTFRLAPLKPGAYDITAHAPGGQCAVLHGVLVQAGQESGGHVLNLVPGARLRVRYAGSEGYLSYSILCDGVVIASDIVQAGHHSGVIAPAGHVVVKATWSPKASDTRELDIGVGETKEVVFGEL